MNICHGHASIYIYSYQLFITRNSFFGALFFYPFSFLLLFHLSKIRPKQLQFQPTVSCISMEAAWVVGEAGGGGAGG